MLKKLNNKDSSHTEELIRRIDILVKSRQDGIPRKHYNTISYVASLEHQNEWLMVIAFNEIIDCGNLIILRPRRKKVKSSRARQFTEIIDSDDDGVVK